MDNDGHDLLQGMELLLGITGGIAAYKSPLLLRDLVKQGARVRIVTTQHALYFVTPLTLQTLSGSPVLTEMFQEGRGSPLAHIEWTRDIDLLLIAPATANMIGKMANGIADDTLSTMILTVDAPLMIAPAMNPRMYRHPAVVRNLEILKERGVQIIEPGRGELACGEEGIGRMAEPDEILQTVKAWRRQAGPLSGKNVLVTAGPTHEPIDPVRFISSRSSGKMGYALAREARHLGGHVILVSGPTALETPHGVTQVRVETAAEMKDAVEKYFPDTDLLIMAAAVGDYRAESSSIEKIKKERSEKWTVPLVMNPDILKSLSIRRQDQVVVGFAAETEDVLKNAEKKLQEKGLDVIVANDVSQNGIGFGSDNNRVALFDKNGFIEETGVLPKREIARKILNVVCVRCFSDRSSR